MSSFEKFGSLLDEFESLPPAAPYRPTFLEVAGYPSREYVWSNLLAFFLDPKKPHGFESLFLEALLQDELVVGPLSNVSIEREVRTSKGKKIDILIRSETHLIALENKVFHHVNNPFDEYKRYLDEISGGRVICGILLTLKQCDRDPGFRSITYSTLLERIRLRRGTELGLGATGYAALLREFLTTIDRLQTPGGLTTMTQAQLEFLDKGEQNIDKFLVAISGFREELRSQKILPLQELLKEVATYKNVKQILYRVERPNTGDSYLYDALVHKITVGSALPTVTVDAIISAHGWLIQVFLRPKGPVVLLKQHLDKLAIAYQIENDNPERLVCGRFPYSVPPEEAHVKLKKIIDLIAGA
jgi:hypothetical protein